MNEASRTALLLGHAGRLLAEASLVAHSPAVKRLAVSLALVAGLSLSGCSIQRGHTAGPVVIPDIQGVPHCVVVEAVAMTSPHRVIDGAYNCLDSTARSEAAGQHITNDAGFEAYAAQAPVFIHYTYTGLSAGYYSFRLSGPGGQQCFGVQVNSSGLADHLGFAATSTGLCGI